MNANVGLVYPSVVSCAAPTVARSSGCNSLPLLPGRQFCSTQLRRTLDCRIRSSIEAVVPPVLLTLVLARSYRWRREAGRRRCRLQMHACTASRNIDSREDVYEMDVGGQRLAGMSPVARIFYGSELNQGAAIRQAEVKSRAFYLSQCPPEDVSKPEFAIFGRSNVGKSSLLNYICGEKMTSTGKRKGHTYLIFHILINKSYYLCDMPGIGLAVGDVEKLTAMDKLMKAYIRHRRTLAHVLFLVDGSVPPAQIDIDGIKWLMELGLDLTVVFTKSDARLTEKQLNGSMKGGIAQAFTDAMWKLHGSPWRLGNLEMPKMILTSATAKTGRNDLLNHIYDLRTQMIPRVMKAKAGGKAKQKTMKANMDNTPPPAIR